MAGIPIERLAVIGTGLIGGSFALALRPAVPGLHITGFDLDRVNLECAHRLSIIDRMADSAADAVCDAQVVFLAVPVCAVPGVVRSIAPALPAGCIVTDGGSVKVSIVEACEALLPPGCFFVGGHPIAGTENSGAVAAFPSLYTGKRCVLTPTPCTDAAALETVARLWEAAGACVCRMDAARHDRIFAEISHLPHMVAYALVHAVGTADSEGENVLSYTAGGFRDFTRIASSDPVMWRDIALMNRDALLASIDGFSRSLADLRARVGRGDTAGLEEFFTIAKQFRDAIL